MTQNVSLVMAYYENAGMLAEHYQLLEALPPAIKDFISLVIVDDGSPTAPALPPDRDIGVPVQIYRVDVDVRWNQDAARNIGMNHAETSWCLLTDIDHIVPEKTWRKVITMEVERGTAYTFGRVSAPDNEPYKFHPNTWLMHRALFDRVGGYDERFAGYYGTDGDFRDRLNLSGAKIVALKEYVIRVPRAVIPDASTTTYLRKQPEDRVAIPRIKAQRAADKDPTPKRLTFPYHRVFP